MDEGVFGSDAPLALLAWLRGGREVSAADVQQLCTLVQKDWSCGRSYLATYLWQEAVASVPAPEVRQQVDRPGPCQCSC